CKSASARAARALSLKRGEVAAWVAPSVIASLIAPLGRGPRREPDRGLVRHSCQHFGDMAGRNIDPVALQLADHVPEAAEVAGEQQIGAGRRDGGGLLADDGIRNLRILHAESAAKAAADVGIKHLGEPQPLYGGEETPRLIANPKLAQARAGIVIG